MPLIDYYSWWEMWEYDREEYHEMMNMRHDEALMDHRQWLIDRLVEAIEEHGEWDEFYWDRLSTDSFFSHSLTQVCQVTRHPRDVIDTVKELIVHVHDPDHEHAAEDGRVAFHCQNRILGDERERNQPKVDDYDVFAIVKRNLMREMAAELHEQGYEADDVTSLPG